MTPTPRIRSGDARDVWILRSPKAGTGLSAHTIDLVAARLTKISWHVRVTDQLAELEERSREDPNFIAVAAGGDGTVNAVASRLTNKTPLVVIPTGTENLLAKHFGLRACPDQVLQAITAGRPFKIDAGLVTKLRHDDSPKAASKMFLVVTSAGFDAHVVRTVHLRRKGHVNRWTYAGPIINAVRSYPFPPIQTLTADGMQEDVDTLGWAMAFNLPRYAAGLPLCENADATDGKLDLVGLPGQGLPTGIGYLSSLLTSRWDRRNDITRRRVQEIVLRSDTDVPFQVDGDYGGKLPIRISSIPSRVNLQLPPETHAADVGVV